MGSSREDESGKPFGVGGGGELPLKALPGGSASCMCTSEASPRDARQGKPSQRDVRVQGWGIPASWAEKREEEKGLVAAGSTCPPWLPPPPAEATPARLSPPEGPQVRAVPGQPPGPLPDHEGPDEPADRTLLLLAS